MPTSLPLFTLALFLVFARTCAETETLTYDGSVACGGVCIGARPHCLEPDAVCVECLEDAHCGADRPLCNATTHACERCTSDASCHSAEQVCDTATGRCGGCTTDAQCSGRAATPVCDEASGQCVACTADTEATTCGLYSCHRTTHTCTTTLRGSVVLCGDCQSDSECASSSVCVTRTFGTEVLGSYCLKQVPAQGCGHPTTNPGLLPFAYPTNVVSVEGVQSSVCSPREGLSCLAIQRLQAGCTAANSGPDDACGDARVGDGQCTQLAGQSIYVCTYTCSGVLDCRSTASCGQGGSDVTPVCH